MDAIPEVKADILRIGPFYIASCAALDSRTAGLTEDEVVLALKMKINRKWGGIFTIDMENT